MARGHIYIYIRRPPVGHWAAEVRSALPCSPSLPDHSSPSPLHYVPPYLPDHWSTSPLYYVPPIGPQGTPRDPQRSQGTHPGTPQAPTWSQNRSTSDKKGATLIQNIPNIHPKWIQNGSNNVQRCWNIPKRQTFMIIYCILKIPWSPSPVCPYACLSHQACKPLSKPTAIL